MSKESTSSLNQSALEYHKKGRPGKIAVTPTKACLTSRDLSLAYSPGVAAPCLEIAKNEEDVYKYTAKGNLVAVISNGSAVLGLGNIGPSASKPVMEGKGVLFKRFADVDVFDIEIDESDVDGMVRVIKSLEPTFGGINLEDIKAPECFEVERILQEQMNIPVFHDDQHGTAIIAAAGLLNALEITGKKIDQIKSVFSGAGAASIACARLFVSMGVKKENILMTDSKGVINHKRDSVNKYKAEFQNKTNSNTLADAMKGADVFIGCSAKGVLTQEMVKTMADDPIIFAMANPDPEILPNEVYEVRKDALVATGRSDFPNQVNNVLGFPFIFRGALDVRAKKINEDMKIAAAKALADLAKEEVPDEVRQAYNNEHFEFGKDYLIPKPFDRRALTRVTIAVAKAAISSGVARKEIRDFGEYAQQLEDRLGGAAGFVNSLKERIPANKKPRIIFAEGANDKILQAVSIVMDDEKIEPILLGPKEKIMANIEKLGISNLDSVEIISPETDENYKSLRDKFFELRQRKGVSRQYANELMKRGSYYGSMLVREGIVDGMITGATQTYRECVKPVLRVIGTENGETAAGIIVLVFPNRVLFLADCTIKENPNAQDLSNIALATAKFYKKLMLKVPRVAFLSHSSFGSTQGSEGAKKVADAVKLTKQADPSLICDGELQADVAVNKSLLEEMFPFSDLDQAADILVFPNLSAANISYKLLAQLGQAKPIGPILIPMNKAINIVQRTSTVSEIVNMATITAVHSQIQYGD